MQYLGHTYMKTILLLVWNSNVPGCRVLHLAPLALSPILHPMPSLLNQVKCLFSVSRMIRCLPTHSGKAAVCQAHGRSFLLTRLQGGPLTALFRLRTCTGLLLPPHQCATGWGASATDTYFRIILETKSRSWSGHQSWFPARPPLGWWMASCSVFTWVSLWVQISSSSKGIRHGGWPFLRTSF